MNKLREEIIINKFREKYRRRSKRTLENRIPQLRNEIDEVSSKMRSVDEIDSLKLKEKLLIKGIEIIEVQRELARRENNTKLK